MSTKISALTDGTTANSTDRIPVSRSGANRYITPDYLMTFMGGLVAMARTNGGESLTNPGEDKLRFDVVDYDPHSTITTGASWKFTAPTTGKYLVAILHMLLVPGASMNYTAGDQIKILRYATGKSTKTVLQITKGITETQNEPYNTILPIDVVSLTAADELSYNLYRSITDAAPTVGSDALIVIIRMPVVS